MIPGPLAIICELTHRCPLRCVYCSNPVALMTKKDEITTSDWIEIITQSQDLGAAHIHFTGGEPLLRTDLVSLVSHARACGLYTNLITSGVGLTESRLNTLTDSGLDHIQLSLQDVNSEGTEFIAGARVFNSKQEAARRIRKLKIAFTINFVVHRFNIHRLEKAIELAHEMGAHKLEIAHVQYHGWALKNRSALLPSRSQVLTSIQVVEEARSRLKSIMHIEFVTPDYYAKTPKPCMGGWGTKLMVINPHGEALPCHSAKSLPGFSFPRVTEHSLAWIWRESPLFQTFRGETWMPRVCRTCPTKAIDFAGCRCQAFVLTGDHNQMDPVCHLSPDRHVIDEAIKDHPKDSLVYRQTV